MLSVISYCVLDHAIDLLFNFNIRQYIEIALSWRNTPSWATNARFDTDKSYATWTEEDCSLSLAMDKDSVLDRHFDDITVERVSSKEQGWKTLDDKPLLWSQWYNI